MTIASSARGNAFGVYSQLFTPSTVHGYFENCAHFAAVKKRGVIDVFCQKMPHR